MPEGTKVFDIYAACADAISNGVLIESVSDRDKEFHFQNWIEARLASIDAHYENSGRNIYPDFRLVEYQDGYEVKGLAWPGRERDYDSNSQVPTGYHNGRTIFYIFGRYPADLSEYNVNSYGHRFYPVVDLIICHGSFLNADHSYIHKNKSVKGFGSYGDILIRDRKMYVAPTPFALTSGTTGLSTLILPNGYDIDDRFKVVGELDRKETDEIVIGYSFNLTTNELTATKAKNPDAGKTHQFKALRLLTQTDRKVSMAINPDIQE